MWGFFFETSTVNKERLFLVKGRLLRNKGSLFAKRRIVAFDTPSHCH